MYGYIYKITNTINGKIYVGKRAKSKFDESYYGSGVAITSSIKKYGKKNFDREILEWCETNEELNKAEIYWIAKLCATDKSIGYNLASGGDGGYVGEEACKKISDKKLGKPSWNSGKTDVYSQDSLNKMSNSHKNKPTWNAGKTNVYSQESLNKMSIAKDNYKKQVYCIELNKTFKSSREACIILNINIKERKKINRCCLGYRKDAFNYHWKYLE